MAGRLRRRSGAAELAVDEGPFVSFTDLFIGILFLFLILVAALMLMHQEAIRLAAEEQRRLNEQIRILQAKLDALADLDINHPPFRLGIVFNSYQRPAGSGQDWTFTRSVEIFRSRDGLCLENVLVRNNLNFAWKPPIPPEDVPTAKDVQMGAPCTLSASGEHWDSPSETGGVRRVSPNLYSGTTVLHRKEGDKTVEIQYRILGVYDDYYR